MNKIRIHDLIAPIRSCKRACCVGISSRIILHPAFIISCNNYLYHIFLLMTSAIRYKVRNRIKEVILTDTKFRSFHPQKEAFTHIKLLIFTF